VSRDALLYIADIVAAGDAIARYIDGVPFEAFAANDEKRAAVERQVFVIGEAAARLPDDWRQLRPDVPWRKIVGLRNLLAHGYWVIDADELWDVALNKVPEFVAALRPLLDAPLAGPEAR
jgi:uncharacterized protein with HEPN domain